jgi:hypothetical protein
MASGRWIRAGCVAGALAAIVVIGALYNEARPPAIHAISMPHDDPGTLRFVISNPAFTITVKDVDLTCVPLESQTHTSKDGKPAHAAPFVLNVDVDLPPRGAFEYTCPIKTEDFADAPGTLDAKIGVKYTKFGHRAQSWSDALTWDPASRVWTEANH